MENSTLGKLLMLVKFLHGVSIKWARQRTSVIGQRKIKMNIVMSLKATVCIQTAYLLSQSGKLKIEKHLTAPSMLV
jgi:hypothetical protein